MKLVACSAGWEFSNNSQLLLLYLKAIKLMSAMYRYKISIGCYGLRVQASETLAIFVGMLRCSWPPCGYRQQRPLLGWQTLLLPWWMLVSSRGRRISQWVIFNLYPCEVLVLILDWTAMNIGSCFLTYSSRLLKKGILKMTGVVEFKKLAPWWPICTCNGRLVKVKMSEGFEILFACILTTLVYLSFVNLWWN